MARKVVAKVESIFAIPILPKIATKAAKTAESRPQTIQILMVGDGRLELPTSSSQTTRSTN